MLKKYYIFIFLFFLSNCSTPGSAFLGPTFTGFKTGSVYQTTLSYGSGQTINILKDSLIEIENKSSLVEVVEVISEIPPALISLTTHDITVSEVIEEEPLP